MYRWGEKAGQTKALEHFYIADFPLVQLSACGPTALWVKSQSKNRWTRQLLKNKYNLISKDHNSVINIDTKDGYFLRCKQIKWNKWEKDEQSVKEKKGSEKIE